ncbi:MAG: hypothetical protein KH246_10395, partial [Collinsella sp.]|nr:hypothetical protein [Collinsella sp.]
VAFDEFAGKAKKAGRDLVDIMKNYMANKSFSRGVETFQGEASMAFVGNTSHNVPYMLKNSDLFEELPKQYHDPAFLDRIHFYLPGWEFEQIRSEMFTSGFGFVVDYLAEILHNLRDADYSDRYATYQTGGFVGELHNQYIYLGALLAVVLAAGALYGLYKRETRFLSVLSLAGAVCTVLLVTRVQNMDDHQSLAVAPFYLLGFFLCALAVDNLALPALRGGLAVLLGGLCVLNFGGCSQLLPIVFPSAVYSGLFFYVDNERTDMEGIAAVNDWLRANCSGANSAYMICHGVVYSADVFRAAALPDESIREMLPYGAVNPGNDAFPKELFTAQVVLTCTP